MILESDSLLLVQAINRSTDNLLEVGHVYESCRNILKIRPDFSLSFVKRQANGTSHAMARVPCLLNCQNLFTSPPSLLVESLMYNLSN